MEVEYYSIKAFVRKCFVSKGNPFDNNPHLTCHNKILHGSV